MNLEQAVGADCHISSLFSVYRVVGRKGRCRFGFGV